MLSISAFNQTKNLDAATTQAAPNDVVVYTLTAQNQTDEVISGHVLEINIEDISKQAILIDAQGANYNSQANSLIWTPLDIPSKGSIEKKFTVRIKDPLPDENDLVMTAKFNNEVNVHLIKRQVAGIDNTPPPAPPSSYSSPTTGASGWLAILLALAATSGILVFRRKRLA